MHQLIGPLSRMNRKYCMIKSNYTCIKSSDKTNLFPSPSKNCEYACTCASLSENIEIDHRHSQHINHKDIITYRICWNFIAFALWHIDVQTIKDSSTVLECKSAKENND